MRTDALTGVQALARQHPGLPLAPGTVARRECASIRQGTRSCSVSRAVATGAVVAPSCGPTRTAADCRAPVAGVVATDPAATRWPCVVDHRNTHHSASLVRCVARAAGLDRDLGEQGQAGILARQARRAAFLRDPSHRVVCHDTPRHSSWRNPIAIGLRILVRTLLKRGSFVSLADLAATVLAFIAYDNRTMAKPVKWTAQGKALAA